MKRLFLFIVMMCIIGVSSMKAQEETVYDAVEQMPEFGTLTIQTIIKETGQSREETKSGTSALMYWLGWTVKYPIIAQENGIQGRVICTFVVERDGSISNVKVVKSIDASLDKEALRVLNSMPKWVPGKRNGKPVRVKYTLPVTFSLR